MNMKLDRLLELHQIKSQTIDIGDNQLTFMEEREYQSLKSQIESKLAQADKYEQFYNDYCNEFHNQKQELSQIRPIVQALREIYPSIDKKLESLAFYTHGYDDDCSCGVCLLRTKISKILASSDVKQ